mgnify:CR=1 FL=1
MVLIPGWWSRTARRRGPGVRRPIRPGRSGGRTGPGAPQDLHPGQPGARPEEEAAGLPRGPCGGLGDLLSGEKSPLNALFGGDKGGINGILKVLRLEELDSGDILLILIILLLLVERDNMDLVITLGLLLLLGLADDRKEEKQGG